MRPVEALAEVVLTSGAEVPATDPCDFQFIVSFGTESFSVGLVPSGSGALVTGTPTEVTLRFLVEAARGYVSEGREFTFWEQNRVGRGKIIGLNDDA